MTMLERVAEAVSQKVMEAPFAILEGHQREYVLSIARAAIEALMEPTDEMIKTGYGNHYRLDTALGRGKAMVDYHCMLKAALEEGK